MHLVSFKRCPYVQRALLVCREKRLEPQISYIDLAAKPDWFLAKSPRGKVPILEVDGAVLFESLAICEYLDETHPEPPLMPTTPIGRARDRMWFISATHVVLPARFQVVFGTDRDAWPLAVEKLADALRTLEAALGDGEYMSGDGSRFGMADVSLAPVVTHMDLARRTGNWEWPAGTERLQAWAKRCLARPSMAASLPIDFEADVRRYQEARGAVLLG